MTYSDQVTDVLIQAWPFSKIQWFIRWNVIWLLTFFDAQFCFYLFLGPRFEAYGVDGGSFSETNFCQRPYLSHKFHLNQLWLRDLPIRRWPKVCYMYVHFWNLFDLSFGGTISKVNFFRPKSPQPFSQWNFTTSITRYLCRLYLNNRIASQM